VRWEHLVTPVAWIDVSDVVPQPHITRECLIRGLEEVGVELRRG
jgi:hypothetical protein